MAGQEQQGGSKSPSRRTVLRSAAGAGAAGVAATALSGLGAAAAAEGGTDQSGRAAAARAVSTAESSEQVVVHVRDARTGQMDVFRGTGQVRLHDRDLARLLDRLSRG